MHICQIDWKDRKGKGQKKEREWDKINRYKGNRKKLNLENVKQSNKSFANSFDKQEL